MNEQTKIDVDKKNKGKLLSGINLAWVYVLICFIGGMGMKQDGQYNQAIDSFIGGSIALLGIFLYLLRKKHNSGKYFTGSKLIEVSFLGILIVFLFNSFTNPLGNWYQSPLTWSITPIWVLVAYLIARFKKPNQVS